MSGDNTGRPTVDPRDAAAYYQNVQNWGPNSRPDNTQGRPGDQGQPWDTNVDPNWRPDYSYSSPQARAWLQESQRLAGQPLDRDQSGLHHVAFGDSIDGIAARELHDKGVAQPTKDQIQSESDKIVQANDQHYPSLDSNRDLIKTGWKLTVPEFQVVRNPDGSQTSAGPADDCCCPCSNRGQNFYDRGGRGPIFVNINVEGDAYFNGDPSGWFGAGARGQYDQGQRSYYGNRSSNTYYEYDPASWAMDQQLSRQADAYAYSGGAPVPLGEYYPPRGDQNSGYNVYAPVGRQRPQGPDMYGWSGGNGTGQGQDMYGWSGQDGSGSAGGDPYAFSGPSGPQTRDLVYRPSDRYSVQTLPYDPSQGYSVETLPYYPNQNGNGGQPFALAQNTAGDGSAPVNNGDSGANTTPVTDANQLTVQNATGDPNPQFAA